MDAGGPPYGASLQVGDVCDCLDTEQKWRIAEIISRDHTHVLVHYVDWSPKWDEWIALRDPRLQPPRTKTNGYTGPANKKPNIGAEAAAASAAAFASAASASAASASSVSASAISVSAASASALPAPPVAASLARSLDCPNCLEPFEPKEGPRYPRILTPCAHTFCTECIERQLDARGNGAFRCLLHNSDVVGVTKATDAKANFALIELLEKVQKDDSHRAQQRTDRQMNGQHARESSCIECDKPAVWYCKNDDACFCDAHKASEHQSKSRAKHTIVPVSERGFEIPKCVTHTSRDLDMWCQQCGFLCCELCVRFGEHKAHQEQLLPVGDIAADQRKKVAQLSEQAKEVSSTQMTQKALELAGLHQRFESSVEGTRRAIDELAAKAIAVITSRAQTLHENARKQGAAGLAGLQQRIDALTVCRSEAAAVVEEASRVLRMNDYAILEHASSVEQLAKRADASWVGFQANSSEPQPQPMQFVSDERMMLDEIAVVGLVHMPPAAAASSG